MIASGIAVATPLVEILELAQNMGIPLSEEPILQAIWDGEALHLKALSGRVSNDLLLHELGHYVVSNKAFRSFPEYGLRYIVVEAAGILSIDEEILQEQLATIVGWHFCRLLGIRVVDVQRYTFHAFDKKWLETEVPAYLNDIVECLVTPEDIQAGIRWAWKSSVVRRNHGPSGYAARSRDLSEVC